uniref:Glycosyltransferase n=1 Tax=candidate division WOR-3 bacterium TaxID=2052148 RepID=A0A7C4GJR3_UNCW3
MFDPIALCLFWLPFAVFVYHWVLFPGLLWLFGRIRPRRLRCTFPPDTLSVSLVMAVHNEEPIIAQKVKNCLELDYPPDKVEILIGSDNSTDRTEEIIRSFNDPRIRLFHYEPQAGKTVVQNRLLQEADGDVVLCTDADSLLTPKSLRLMLEHMRDPGVAVVNPRYRRINDDGSPAESIYDRWETKVKELEGRIGALVGCNAYANMVRRSEAGPIPDYINLDDFYLGIRPFRNGLDVVCEPRALVVTRAESEAIEFRRKARISSGNLQALLHFRDLLLPRYGRKAWVYFSHKVLRMVIPFLLLAMLVGSALKAAYPFFLVLLLLQAVTYVTTPLVFVVKGRLRRLFAVQYYLLMNTALVVGYWRHFFRPEKYWKKTPRAGAASG